MTIRVPDSADLDHIAELIGGEGMDFEDLGPEARVQVLTLAIAADRNNLLDEIDSRLSHVSIWFEKSRLYEP